MRLKELSAKPLQPCRATFRQMLQANKVRHDNTIIIGANSRHKIAQLSIETVATSEPPQHVMADNKEQPKIFANLSLEPTTHSCSSTQAPNLNLTLTLEHDEPITIYADDLSLSRMILCGAFDIHDSSTGVEVKQSKRTNCKFEPPSKVEVTLNESLFHTLQPNVPLTFSAPFSRHHEKPRPASEPEHTTSRHGASGVDCLEPDREYVLTLASNPRVHWHRVRWWEYGTKEEVLARGLDARKVKFRPGPQEAIEIDTSQIEPIEFRTVQ